MGTNEHLLVPYTSQPSSTLLRNYKDAIGVWVHGSNHTVHLDAPLTVCNLIDKYLDHGEETNNALLSNSLLKTDMSLCLSLSLVFVLSVDWHAKKATHPEELNRLLSFFPERDAAMSGALFRIVCALSDLFPSLHFVRVTQLMNPALEEHNQSIFFHKIPYRPKAARL